jgi:hypothetical protein
MRRLLLALLVVGCAGDSPPPSGKCTGAAYEPCLEEHNCNAGLCQNFIDEGFQVCTIACDESIPCPTGGTCDTARGVCVPDEAVDCELEP